MTVTRPIRTLYAAGTAAAIVLLWSGGSGLLWLVAMGAVTVLSVNWARRARPWVVWRVRRNCFHHDHRTGQTWIQEQLIETGMRKLFYCRACRRVWIT